MYHLTFGCFVYETWWAGKINSNLPHISIKRLHPNINLEFLISLILAVFSISLSIRVFVIMFQKKRKKKVFVIMEFNILGWFRFVPWIKVGQTGTRRIRVLCRSESLRHVGLSFHACQLRQNTHTITSLTFWHITAYGMFIYVSSSSLCTPLDLQVVLVFWVCLCLGLLTLN